MCGYIRGIVKEIESNYIILENNGVGYLIYTPNRYSFNLEEEYTVYIYQNVKEEELTLYGFKLKEEKDLFLKLIAVNGLGCKMALPILATGSINGIVDAIERENILYLKKFPKIGDKIARQIILDLKGKLNTSSIINNNNNDELIEVLKGLGYKTNDILKVIKQVNNALPLEEQIREALKLFLKWE